MAKESCEGSGSIHKLKKDIRKELNKMKLTKKLLIVAIMASLLTPMIVKETKRPSFGVTIVADGSSTSVDYNDNNGSNKTTRPKSIHVIKAI